MQKQKTIKKLSLYELLSKFIERFCIGICTFINTLVFCKKLIHKTYIYIGVSRDKTMIKFSKSKENSNVFLFFGSGPIVNYINSEFLYINNISFYLKTSEINLPFMKLTHFKFSV